MVFFFKLPQYFLWANIKKILILNEKKKKKKKISMNAYWSIMEDVMNKRFVKIYQEVLIVHVKQDIMEMGQIVMVTFPFFNV